MTTSHLVTWSPFTTVRCSTCHVSISKYTESNDKYSYIFCAFTYCLYISSSYSVTVNADFTLIHLACHLYHLKGIGSPKFARHKHHYIEIPKRSDKIVCDCFFPVPKCSMGICLAISLCSCGHVSTKVGIIYYSIIIYGCFRKWWYPQIIHFNRVFHYKPSILGYH